MWNRVKDVTITQKFLSEGSNRLDQNSRRFLIFPCSVMQNIFTKWPPLPGLTAVKQAGNYQNKNYRIYLEFITRELDGKIGCVNVNIFHHTQKKSSGNRTKIRSRKLTFTLNDGL